MAAVIIALGIMVVPLLLSLTANRFVMKGIVIAGILVLAILLLRDLQGTKMMIHQLFSDGIPGALDKIGQVIVRLFQYAVGNSDHLIQDLQHVLEN